MKAAGTVVKYKHWWEARISYTDHSKGKRVYVRRKRRTKTEARLTLDEMKSQLKKRGSIERQPDKLSFDEVAVKYEQRKVVPAIYRGGKKVAGMRSLRAPQCFLRVLRAHFGSRQVKTITYGDLQHFRNLRLNTKTVSGGDRSVASVNREIAVLHGVIRFAMQNGWIERNPFEAGETLIRMSDANKRERVMSYEEEALMLSHCTEKLERLGVMIILAVDSGIRRGEMLQLEWTDVDFEALLIRLRGFTTKTNKPREVAMTSRVAAGLRDWREKMPPNQPLVFGLRANFQRDWDKALQLAGIENLHWHDLRHTCATRMTAAGVPVAEMMRITGHSTSAMAYRYINPGTDALYRAAEALDAQHQQKAVQIESTMIN